LSWNLCQTDFAILLADRRCRQILVFGAFFPPVTLGFLCGMVDDGWRFRQIFLRFVCRHFTQLQAGVLD
jgi:hypothetical protein